MNLQSLVVVVLRLMALNFLVRVALQLTPQLLSLVRISQRSTNGGSSSLMAFPLLLLAFLLVVAILLWIFALPIARAVTRGVPQDLFFGALSLVDCYSIAFMAVGLYYSTSHLPQVLNWTYYLFKTAAGSRVDSWQDRAPGYDMTLAFLPFIIGIILFVKGRSWAVALARRQEQAESSNPIVLARLPGSEESGIMGRL